MNMGGYAENEREN